MTDWKGKTRGGSFGYLFFIFLIKKIGIRAAYIFLCLVVPYFIPFAPKATRSIWTYSRRILKQSRLKSIALLFKNYYCFGQTIIDKVAIGNGMTDKYQFLFENYDEFLKILDSDSGAIIIGAHIGNWQIGTPFFEDYAKKINIVLYDAEYRKIKEIMERNSVKLDYKIIPVNNNDLNHVFEIKEALDNSEYVCFQGDRFLREERVLPCKFMGYNANFPQGPYLLASKLRVPVIYYFAMREKKQTYRFHFTIAEIDKTAKSNVIQQSLLEQYASALENTVRKYPEQWFNYYDFWQLKSK